MLVLAAAIQSGPSVGERYEAEGVVANTITGTGLEDVNTLQGYNQWLTSDFIDLFEPDDNRGQGRIFMNTYNEIVGSLRVEVLRIDPSACEWKVDGYWKTYRLQENKSTGCYGYLSEKTSTNVRRALEGDHPRARTRARARHTSAFALCFAPSAPILHARSSLRQLPSHLRGLVLYNARATCNMPRLKPPHARCRKVLHAAAV